MEQTNDKKEIVKEQPTKQQLEIKEQIEETLIKMLMRQTTYTREEAIASFEKNKTIDKCIEEYLGYEKKEEKITTNQAIFKTIRTFFSN
jgi:hypothetical protein